MWNEIDSSREHDLNVDDYVAMYNAQVHAMTDGIAALELGSSEGSAGLVLTATQLLVWMTFFIFMPHKMSSLRIGRFVLCAFFYARRMVCYIPLHSCCLFPQ